MSVWSQYRSYASWPTEALLVGPNTASRSKWTAWAISAVAGFGLGLAWWSSTSKGMFTLSAKESVFGTLSVLGGVVVIPMVVVALVLPRIGGPLLMLLAVLCAVCVGPAADFDVRTAGVALLGLYGPMLGVGAGFAWSGLRSEPR